MLALPALGSLAFALFTFGVRGAPGEVVCRYETKTLGEVNYYTCTDLARKYSITVEKFFTLNPSVDKDCNTIKPNTNYCVAGCKLYRVQFYTTSSLIPNQGWSFLLLKTACVALSTTMQPALGWTNSVAMEKPGNVVIRCESNVMTSKEMLLIVFTERIVRLERATLVLARVSQPSTVWMENVA